MMVLLITKLYMDRGQAFGNFQFMPSTIMNYAIDYNNDKQINLNLMSRLLQLLII